MSLNDALLPGPDINQPLIDVLFKFRKAPIAVTGDIAEMFLQIETRKIDQDYQRVLWRSNEDQPISHFVMQRMIFGATCSPTIAQFVKNYNAKRYADSKQRAVEAITKNHYVDDYVDCFQSEEEAIAAVQDVINIHAEAGFNLRKILSNSKQVNEMFAGNGSTAKRYVSPDNSERILGMHWDSQNDEFKFDLKFNKVPKEILQLQRKPTKREMLSIIMSVFDPFGLLGNLTIIAKVLMQSLWKSKLEWDDELPEELCGRWVSWLEELKKVRDYKIPRCFSEDFCSEKKQLHIFCDASESATAVVAYWRIEKQGGVKLAFAAGKSNCAPAKYVSMPRLELQAAVFAVRLRCHILKCCEVEVENVVMRTDSTTVVKWINSDTYKYKQFVANSLAEILESSHAAEWRWVPGTLNPADDATRCIQYDPDGRWKNGPNFLMQPPSNWPSGNTVLNCGFVKCAEQELRTKYIGIAHRKYCQLYDISRFSNYARLKRTIAWVRRYVFNLKKKIKQQPLEMGQLTVNEEEDAENLLIKCTQRDAFYEEYRQMRGGHPVKESSVLKMLCPYIDENGLIRCSGRIVNAPNLPVLMKRPVILPKNHGLTRLLVEMYHKRFHHIYNQVTINEIRRKYWVPSLRVLVNSVRAGCNTCKVRRATPLQPIMAPLPVDRVTSFVRPFSYTGLDYFGPVQVTVARRKEKRWIALFTCLSVRAVHLEIAADLSSDACIVCIRNFINRRGVPVQIRSDNGTSFVGITKELGNDVTFLDHNAITTALAPLGVKWKYNTPADPSAGGAWERLVQSVKRALNSMLKEHAPKLETLYSLLVESENIVNSRPLTHLPVTPSEPEPLTPNHFLLGCTNSTQTPAPYEHRLCSLRKQWRLLQNMKNHFWKRWVSEYLPELTRRTKWNRPSKPLRTGSLVLICEADLPRSKWRRGRVLSLRIGPDGVARSAEVNTSSGVLKRPVSKLAVLDVEEDSGECSRGRETIHGGGDVGN